METLFTGIEWVVIALGAILLRVLFAIAVVVAVAVVLVPFVYAFEGARSLVRKLMGVKDLHGLEWRREPRYASTHLWLRERGGVVRVGLDSLAARLLERAHDVALPPVGSRIRKGEPMATFRGGATMSLPAPVDGTVVAVNARLSDGVRPAIEHPYGGGWLLEIEPADHTFEALPRAEQARAWFNEEAARLTLALEHVAGVAAADGGLPLVPHHQMLTDEQAGCLAQDFLHASVPPQAA
jgi:glycine cleavage system H protein